MVKPHAKEAELYEVIQVANNLREADVRELEAMHGVDASLQLILLDSWRVSSKAWSIIHEGNSIGSFGVAPISNGWGSPWLLATDELPRISKEFIKQCPILLEEMHCEFPNLINYVHSENIISIRWLTYLGFTIMPPITIGVGGEQFHPFIKTKRS